MKIVYLFLFITQIAFAKQKINIYADDGAPPYSFIKNGKLTGLYIDLISEVNSKMKNFEINLIPIPWKRGISMLENGEIFALIPPYKIASRAFLKDFSHELFEEKVVISCYEKIKNNIVKFPESFLKKKIAINSGYLISDDFNRAKEHNQIVVEEGYDVLTNVKRLLTKRVDCFVNDEIGTKYAQKVISEEEQMYKGIEIYQEYVLVKQKAYVGYTNFSDRFSYKDKFIKEFDHELIKIQKSKFYGDLIQKYSN